MIGPAESSLVLTDAELDGERVDVFVDGAAVAAIRRAGASVARGDVVIDCDGGALLPGLHDHHLHLLSMAAALGSLDVGGQDLDAVIASAHGGLDVGVWLRAVGYDEAAHGALDRARLDGLAPGRPVRVQHRSGALWVLSSAALRDVGAVESHPDGRLYRLDDWLKARVPVSAPPDLAAVGRRLASYGVTGATDCTPTESPGDLELLAGAARSGALPLTVMTTGGVSLAEAAPPDPLLRGPVKVVLSDHQLPALADVVAWFRRAHRAGRPVAVHCVTRASLVLALAAWGDAGAQPGDRIEHGSVAPLELAADLARLGLTVVTQPGFIAARGDVYLRDVDAEDRGDLYRCSSLIAHGVAVGGSTDAPFGPDDPWVAIRSAVDRRTASGAVVGGDEALSPANALDLFLAPLDRPGGPPRSIEVGGPADFCVLDRPLADALVEPSSGFVVAAVASGRAVYRR